MASSNKVISKKIVLAPLVICILFLVYFISRNLKSTNNFQTPQMHESKFLETFDGTPSSPMNAVLPNWDIQVHSRDENTWYQLKSMHAQHGSDFSAPPAMHVNNTYEGAVFLCKNHLMTAISADYAAIYLTPPYLLDFKKDGVISFDISTERMSKLDWWDVWISPYDSNLAIPFTSGDPDIKGEPEDSVHITIEDPGNIPTLYINQNGKQKQYKNGLNIPFNSKIKKGTNQSAVRQAFKITLSKNHLKFERLKSSTGEAIVFFDTDLSELNFDTGVVQFGHHSYDPEKDPIGKPGTWHWDNISLNPSIPFSITRGNRRYIDNKNQTLNFTKPAPQNSYLRFNGIGKIEVSYNGNPFVEAQKAGWAKNHAWDPKHFASYWTQIPQGTKSLRLKFSPDGNYTGPFIAKDFSIWSR